MNINDFTFDNPKYAPLRNPAREVIGAYQTANRFLDTTQEVLYIEYGMKYLSRLVHNLAHEMPKRFDKFGDMLHERHLMTEYASTPELDWREELKSVDDCFAMVIRVLESVQEALEKFHVVTDNAEFRPMALKTEEFMLQISEDYTMFLQLWKRFNVEKGSLTSFDSYCAKFLHDEDDD